MNEEKKEELKILLSTGKITTLAYLHELGGLEFPFERPTIVAITGYKNER